MHTKIDRPILTDGQHLKYVDKENRSTEESAEPKTNSGEIGLDIKTDASPKVGQDQVSGGVSVLCWHATPVANVL